MTLLAELYAVPWAVRPELLAAVLRYVERHDATPEMLARACHFDPQVQEQAKAARWNRYAVHQQTSVLVDGSQALYRRGRTAILPITGPIVRRGNLMSSLSGGPMTSVELLAKDFTRALEDPSFTSILLDIDSPGGEASGIAELAAIIAAARDQKRIAAYVGDLGASAAYWLASAASEIVVNRTAAVGSIGVVMAVPDPKLDPDGRIEFVSSASPNKRPDPHSKDGKAQIQGMVDVYGDLFVEDVAAQRGTTVETVLADFGQGGLRVGQDAVDHGMADRLGSFEQVLAEMARPADEPPALAPRARPTLVPPDRPRSEPADAGAQLLWVGSASSPAVTVGSSNVVLRSAVTAAEDAPMPTLLDSLRQLVAVAEAPASADREADVMSRHITPTPESVTGGTAPHPPAAVPARAADLDPTLQQRLIAAEAENARLRSAQIQARADTFVRVQTDELRAFAPEVDHLVALYCVLAQDDETYGPLQLGRGRATTRISYLENLMASRQSRRELTVDLMDDTIAHVLTERARPKSDPTAAATTAEIAAYLGQTATGRAALGRIAGAGAGH
jgi:ClpP class serine protease